MPKLTPSELGALVRRIRKAQGLRQDELAGAARVGVRFIVDLEAGKPTAQIGKALVVLDALGCSLKVVPPPGLELGDES
ncbi:helix-turn-helix domain-containing protein [Holophaga foetida]|uniref:helix-turn-helix domain-containing protein n=1 Tax=Holophaga foetida TaxID=35839 RepID=UPI00024736FB|nr:helix-turn-helix domain-containing protein [Holophaga foetida]